MENLVLVESQINNKPMPVLLHKDEVGQNDVVIGKYSVGYFNYEHLLAQAMLRQILPSIAKNNRKQLLLCNRQTLKNIYQITTVVGGFDAIEYYLSKVDGAKLLGEFAYELTKVESFAGFQAKDYENLLKKKSRFQIELETYLSKECSEEYVSIMDELAEHSLFYKNEIRLINGSSINAANLIAELIEKYDIATVKVVLSYAISNSGKELYDDTSVNEQILSFLGMFYETGQVGKEAILVYFFGVTLNHAKEIVRIVEEYNISSPTQLRLATELTLDQIKEGQEIFNIVLNPTFTVFEFGFLTKAGVGKNRITHLYNKHREQLKNINIFWEVLKRPYYRYGKETINRISNIPRFFEGIDLGFTEEELEVLYENYTTNNVSIEFITILSVLYDYRVLGAGDILEDLLG